MGVKSLSIMNGAFAPGRLGLAAIAVVALSMIASLGFAKPAAAAEVSGWVDCGTRNEFRFGKDGNNYRFPTRGFCLTGGNSKLIFQHDGNLVFLYNNNAVWSSRTWGRPNATLVLQNDGNIVIYDQGRAVYGSDTYVGGPGVLPDDLGNRRLIVGNTDSFFNSACQVNNVCTNDLALMGLRPWWKPVGGTGEYVTSFRWNIP